MIVGWHRHLIWRWRFIVSFIRDYRIASEIAQNRDRNRALSEQNNQLLQHQAQLMQQLQQSQEEALSLSKRLDRHNDAHIRVSAKLCAFNEMLKYLLSVKDGANEFDENELRRVGRQAEYSFLLDIGWGDNAKKHSADANQQAFWREASQGKVDLSRPAHIEPVPRYSDGELYIKETLR